MSFKRLFATVVMVFGIVGITDAQAQLPAGSFGIGANISSGQPGAQLLYAAHTLFQLSINASYNINSSTNNSVSNGQTSNTETDNSSYMIGLGGKAFFRSQGVLPFLSISVLYSAIPKTTQVFFQTTRTEEAESIGADIDVGAQYFFTPNFAVHGQFGVSLFKGSQNSSLVSTSGSNFVMSQTQDEEFTRINFGNPSLGVSFFF